MKRRYAVVAFAALGAVSTFAEPVPGWLGGALSWGREGAAMRAFGPRGFAVADMPASGRVTFTAEVTPGKPTGDVWCTLGIGLMQDVGNYWLLNLSRSPEKDGARALCELNEMRGGIWCSAGTDRLRTSVQRGDGRWEVGKTYRLTVELSSGGVTGRIERADGGLVFMRGYEFAMRPAVRYGVPLVYSKGGFPGMCAAMDVESDARLRRPATVYPPYVSRGTVPGVTGRKTGFFHMEKAPDGRWWAIDPNGNATFIRGVDHVRYKGHACELLKGRSLYAEANAKKYGSVDAWEKETLKRLGDWGFNALGAGCQKSLERRGLAHTLMIGLGQRMTKSGDDEQWIGPDTSCPRLNFPNVFHPQFQAIADEQAQIVCAPHRDDPWLIGYYIDNELSWLQAGGHDGLFNRVMTKDPAHTAKAALRDFLKDRAKGDLAAFNRLWGTKIASFDEILGMSRLPSGTPERMAVKTAFLALAADRYFSVAARAIRRFDPNHMNLGARFSGTDVACVWAAAGRHCDLLAFNCYPWADLDRNVVFRHRGRGAERVADLFNRYYEWSGKPLYVTEWSFPSFESGLPCTVGAGERFHTQRERAEATSLYAKTMLALPQIAGYNYFMWVDEPPLGISVRFPEDSNYGLVNARDEPYSELVKTFADLHAELPTWRKAPLPAERKLPPAEPLTAEKVAANVAKTLHEDALPVAYVREGDAYVVSNAIGLVVRGHVGAGFPLPVLDHVSLRGKDMGSLSGVLVVKNGGRGDRWQHLGAVKAVTWKAEAKGSGVLTLVCRGGYGRKGTPGHTPYEATLACRFFPDRPWILASLEKVVNLAQCELGLKFFSFRQFAPFQHDLRPGKGFRPAWREADKGCWIEMDTGAFAGALSYAPDLLRINYDATVLKGDVPAHRRHGDPKRPYANPLTALAPNAAWTVPSGGATEFAGRAWILCVYGEEGGDPTWRKATWAAEGVIGRGAAAGETSMGW